MNTTYYKHDRRGRKIKHFTRGTFMHWYKGGTFGFWYAVFQRSRGLLLIPLHDLTPESKAALPPVPSVKPFNALIWAEGKERKPIALALDSPAENIIAAVNEFCGPENQDTRGYIDWENDNRAIEFRRFGLGSVSLSCLPLDKPALKPETDEQAHYDAMAEDAHWARCDELLGVKP